MRDSGIKVVEVVPHQFKFEYQREALNLQDQVYEAIDKAEEDQNEQAIAKLEDVLGQAPDFIDAMYYYGLVLHDSGRYEEAKNVWQRVVDLGFKALPDTFSFGEDRLEYGWVENRPFLRCYQSLGMAHFMESQYEKALEIFENLLKMNPNDNQGIRGMLIEVAFVLNQPQKVLDVCSAFRDDALADTLYGRVLAELQLGHKENGRKYLEEAHEITPLVAEELLKKRHTRPKNMEEGMITIGGADEAFDYWERFGAFWKQTPGAIDFVREVVENTK